MAPADAQEEDLEPRRFIGLEVHDSYGYLEGEEVHIEDEAQEHFSEDEYNALAAL